MTNGIYVQGFKDLPNGDKELITATIETDLALKMLVDYLGLEYALAESECPNCIGSGRSDFRREWNECTECKGTGKVNKPVIRKKK